MKRVIPIIIFCLSAIQMALAQVTYSPELLQKAKDGDAEAQFNLGWCYGTGTGIQQDDKEAMNGTRKLPSKTMQAPFATSAYIT